MDTITETEKIIEHTKQDTMKQEILKGHDIIQINNDSYLMHIQSSDELPAYDMGLDKIQFTEDAIKKGLNDLIGTFMYDETASQHNKKQNPEMRGRKVAKITDTIYCNNKGGFVTVEPFDGEFEETLKQALDNRERGLPTHEGPSTELNANDGEMYGNNNLKITDLSYNGLVWTDNPRDAGLGVCSVINNSINELLEDDILTDEIKLSKTDYDDLVKMKDEYMNLKPEYIKEYNELKIELDELKTEKDDLYKQLVPVWTAEEGEHLELVNSILEVVPEAEREDKKELFKEMKTDQLKVIINSIQNQERGIQEQETPEPEEPEEYTWKTYKERRQRGYNL